MAFALVLEKNRIISLTFSNNILLFRQSIKARPSLAGRFRSEGEIHLSLWQPEVWNYENFFRKEGVTMAEGIVQRLRLY